MKAVREKALSAEDLVSALELTSAEAAHVDVLIRWAQCNKYWHRNRDNHSAEKAMGEAILAVEAVFPDYNRRMAIMNQILGLMH